jgi:hypothetical protein
MNDMSIGAILENVADEMLEGFQVISHDWRYLYVNKLVALQGKSTKEQLLGRTMTECYPGIDATPVFAQMKRTMTERVSVRMENAFTYPDGSTRWFQLYMHPVQEGLIVLSVDITDRKTVEHVLREKIEELDRIINLTVRRENEMADMKRLISKLKELAPRDGTIEMTR